ncbi:TRAP transporter small permease [Roseobacter sinensis]|uniref:TRAP transporter small permease protein n=1 Tax=Roseobacter sinensis TaxID=2931391 RepID=A0ABT3BGW1_9RHOB|nr:TRAP transporter small permease [Roseobacter sp. WL0113]MCV3272816.1 TRAP transporter small permease [Roseobacter sp. WL0113]
MTDQHTPTAAPAALSMMNTALDRIAAVCRLITGLSLVTLTIIFGWLVFGRYVLNATPTWVEQAALLLVMTIAFLGAAVGIHENTHLSVTAFRSIAPGWMRRLFVVITDLSLAGFGLLLLWQGTKLTLFKWGSTIPLIQVPEGLRSLPLTIGGGLILLFTLGHLVRLATGRDPRRDTIV